LRTFFGGRGIFIHRYCAVRKDLFDRLFDPYLGFGEDQDFFEYHLIKNKNINPIIIDVYVGRHEPHTFRELIRQQLWYWSTFYAFAKKHNIKILRYIAHTHYSAAYTLLLIISLVISLLLYSWSILSLLIFLTTLIFTIYRRALKIYSKIPLHYRKIKIIAVFEVVELIIKPIFFLLGTLRYILTTRKRSKDVIILLEGLNSIDIYLLVWIRGEYDN
jgi:hypothetical protein